MARQGNPFAVLDSEEREVSMLIESIAAKVKVSSRQSKAKKNEQKYSPSPDSGRADRSSGNGGYGFYSERYNGNEAEQSGNSRPNGYGSENGHADCYQYRAKGRADGDRNGAKGPDGDRQDNRHADSDEGWVEVYRYKEGRPFQDDMEFTSRSRNYRGERTGYYVDNRVPRSRVVHETKEGAVNENQVTSGDNITARTEGNGFVTTEVSEEENQQRKHKDEEQKQKDEEQKRKEEERKQKQEAYKEREGQREEDAKKMTLKQYEEIIEKKNKALGISKSLERKVTLDKDFESMQVVAKNKEGDIFIKLNSDADKLKKKESVGTDEDKLKKESVGKVTKIRKVLGICYNIRRDWSQMDGGRDWGRRDGGRDGGRRDGGREGGSHEDLEPAPAMKSPPPPIEDLHLFPTLCKAAKPRT